VANTLAYFDTATIMAVKKIIVQAQGLEGTQVGNGVVTLSRSGYLCS